MPSELTSEMRRTVVQDIATLTREKYVFPDIGEETARLIQAKVAQGGYDDSADASHFASALTADLREVSKDRHWLVTYHPQQGTTQPGRNQEEDEAQLARRMAQLRRSNFGFEKVERLMGNVGHIDLRQFAPSEYGGETAVAAMSFVANCDALIFDLRKNRGGNPSMVQLLISYLVDAEPRHINTWYDRPTDDYRQFWTLPHVPNRRMPDLPVYLLTSHATGSGAEEFAYDLKYMERATVIGETTLGAAHPVTVERVQNHFQVRLPYGRPINPITKGNWEGVGVAPHIAVPAKEALKTAHMHALDRLIAGCRDEQSKRDLAWEKEIVESLYTSLVVHEATLVRYAGRYGERGFAVEDGTLVYSHQALPVSWRLEPITETRFRLGEDFKFEFLLDKQGKASAVVMSYRDGRPENRFAKTA
jgi:hypothetical protein